MNQDRSLHGDARPPEPDVDASLRTGELVARYLGGEHEAERALFERFRAELLARARNHPGLRLLGSQATAEDVVQEVFWRVLSTGILRRFEDRGHGSLGALLGTILDRTLVDLARRLGARKREGQRLQRSLDATATEGARLAEGVADGGTTPTSGARAADLLDRCRELLDGREWQVWSLAEVEGLDSVEIARRLGGTASAIRGVLFRSRIRLIRALGTSSDGLEPETER